ncbi:MAG: hypothetical protein HW421_197 [Ignavibacteria bacterium]|nr:hypothetical protein [Ignavibacteria bacterium]
MSTSMRQTTLETLGLGTTIDIFTKGKLPVNPDEMIDRVFGPASNRGSLVISGANGIVGAGKLMQFGVRLQSYNIPMVAIDFANAPDGIGGQYQGLVSSFGKGKADDIMSGVIRFNYDGAKLPSYLKSLNPKFLLEAIPEILEIKKAHYKIFREAFPGIEIRSVTSGFPSSELGVGIAHPAFPHQINKIWEIVEAQPSDITKMLWALGMIPMTVGDNWSFVLDVLFCGLMLAGCRYHDVSNMPFWKLDKFIRKWLGPNPYRAHDVIGAKGANFLTWSCLHHLSEHYGDLFRPTAKLTEQKNSGANWYPLNHLRPLINWSLGDDEIKEFENIVLGIMIQMTSLLVHEKRAHFTIMNSIGEMCAQFRNGMLAYIRSIGANSAMELVESYHKLYPQVSNGAWYPDVFDQIESTEWQQLYVNAEHDGTVGVISIARESYNQDVNDELNRAIDWLKAAKIERVILSGDFHLSSQLVGADTNEFFPAVTDAEKGFNIAFEWSKTARRLHSEFRNSVGFIGGKRCLGGMLELMSHCHYVVAIEDADLGAPEVTLPVIPGMEMCHLPFRKTTKENWQKLLKLLLDGRSIKAREASGWLIDYSGNMEEALKMAWQLASDGDAAIQRRQLTETPITNLTDFVTGLPDTENEVINASRKAIFDAVKSSCSVDYNAALTLQAKISGDFMTSKYCKNGFIGTECNKTLSV